MKKNTTTMAIAALMILAGATVSSCKKDSVKTTGTTTTTDTNTSSAKDNQDAESNSNDVDQMGAEGMDNGNLNSNYKLTAGSDGGLLSPMSGSANVSTVGKITTITFSSYVGLDGHLRNGTIQYDASASLITATHYRDSGLVISVTTPNHDYYVDSNKIEVTKTISNMGRNTTSHNITWHVVTSLTITKANAGGTITWSATRDNQLLNTNANFSYNGGVITAGASFSGYSNPINWSTAVIGISGGTNGTSADGVGFTANISSMLIRNFGCSPSILGHTHFHPFVAGQIDFTPSGKTTRSINFGTGTCDGNYMVTIGSWNVTLTWLF